MESVKTIDTSIAIATRLDMDDPGSPVNETMYRGIIGSLLYLTASRLDIMFSVGLCARFLSSPKESHLKDAKRILSYLKGTTDLVLFYPSGDNFDLVCTHWQSQDFTRMSDIAFFKDCALILKSVKELGSCDSFSPPKSSPPGSSRTRKSHKYTALVDEDDVSPSNLVVVEANEQEVEVEETSLERKSSRKEKSRNDKSAVVA
ncbi:uncharacterized protein LOC132061326 [Lycium ferocissimum]|uniref:uncharacterized protein LOC132061326 n=1 Tax=Lycium ferocissimum TaxID=112874 RepID=UPI002814B04C|nr:uncharacterized protein LOC132061326 [Lycium ferocissimum]